MLDWISRDQIIEKIVLVPKEYIAISIASFPTEMVDAKSQKPQVGTLYHTHLSMKSKDNDYHGALKSYCILLLLRLNITKALFVLEESLTIVSEPTRELAIR